MSAQQIRNIDPQLAERLDSIGVKSRSDLVELGPGQAYKKLLIAGYEPDENLLWKLVGAAEDRDWQEVASKIRHS